MRWIYDIFWQNIFATKTPKHKDKLGLGIFFLDPFYGLDTRLRGYDGYYIFLRLDDLLSFP
jgi:hypothetical protein